eukprot:5447285-Alexandrium_andersonii.AAC.1
MRLGAHDTGADGDGHAPPPMNQLPLPIQDACGASVQPAPPVPPVPQPRQPVQEPLEPCFQLLEPPEPQGSVGGSSVGAGVAFARVTVLTRTPYPTAPTTLDASLHVGGNGKLFVYSASRQSS